MLVAHEFCAAARRGQTRLGHRGAPLVVSCNGSDDSEAHHGRFAPPELLQDLHHHHHVTGLNYTRSHLAGPPDDPKTRLGVCSARGVTSNSAIHGQTSDVHLTSARVWRIVTSTNQPRWPLGAPPKGGCTMSVPVHRVRRGAMRHLAPWSIAALFAIAMVAVLAACGSSSSPSSSTESERKFEHNHGRCGLDGG